MASEPRPSDDASYRACAVLSVEVADHLLALVMAAQAGNADEVPVGAVMRDPLGHCLAEAGNRPIGTQDPTGHAELRALRQAARRIGNYRLTGAIATVTLEPCPMCRAALEMARIAVICYEAPRPASDTARAHEKKSGLFPAGCMAETSRNTAGPVVGDLPSVRLLRIFFEKRRQG
jgi:tRNA(Arg) A34 adenosine deaminase TadA